ncbi:DUF3631 domain-containing protein [Roseomonas sp. NAR14]|uniref:DUF3631 domain-containing protein n=1 Tax=Roseomonas acroporae TaxID=2937791 RepID=A0A9X2BUI9_9PROT|nr:DUF3631 domain-containing protein [Roseomonas acroporae]MCK8784136.1 DUF3631 domain-containing protein [Roseomonas acroporae]
MSGQERLPDDTPPRDLAAEATEIARLATLDPLAYDREREAAAAHLGIRVGTLDRQVEAIRSKPQDRTAGRGMDLPAVEPWDRAVNAAELLTVLASTIRKHVVMTDAACVATALWAAHTWVHDRFQHTPRLGIRSPAKRCGKSTLLDVLRMLSRRPLKADNISASGVFRIVEALSPCTLLIDEADAFLGDNEELRGVMNSGFEQSGEVIRIVEVQGDLRPTRFATFAPMALAAIGEFPSTLEDRAVPVVLQRKPATEIVTKLRAPGARARLAVLARQLARWAQDRAGHLPTNPAVPDALGDREGDISIPLLAIADDAGGDWPQRGRAALLEVFGRRADDEGTMETGALLLADIKLIFGGLSALVIASQDLCERLGKLEERPWPEWKHGKPMTVVQLARALKPFGVRPSTVRLGNETAKGYYKETFQEAWERYLTPVSASPPVLNRNTVTTLKNTGNFSKFGPVTQEGCDGSEFQENPSINLHCDGVTVQKGGSSGNGIWRGDL